MILQNFKIVRVKIAARDTAEPKLVARFAQQYLRNMTTRKEETYHPRRLTRALLEPIK